MHIGRRVEAAGALLAHLYSSGHGVKSRMIDFMPHEREPEREATDQDIINLFGAMNGTRSRNANT